MFVAEGFEQLLEFGGVFIRQKDPFAREAVTQIILGDNGFAFGRFWTGTVLGVGLIGCPMLESLK